MLSPSELIIRVELKYCEFCGGLWLRREGIQTPYCYTCRPRIKELTEDPLHLRAGRPSRAKLPVLEASVAPVPEYLPEYAGVGAEAAEVLA